MEAAANSSDQGLTKPLPGPSQKDIYSYNSKLLQGLNRKFRVSDQTGLGILGIKEAARLADREQIICVLSWLFHRSFSPNPDDKSFLTLPHQRSFNLKSIVRLNKTTVWAQFFLEETVNQYLALYERHKYDIFSWGQIELFPLNPRVFIRRMWLNFDNSEQNHLLEVKTKTPLSRMIDWNYEKEEYFYNRTRKQKIPIDNLNKKWEKWITESNPPVSKNFGGLFIKKDKKPKLQSRYQSIGGTEVLNNNLKGSTMDPKVNSSSVGQMIYSNWSPIGRIPMVTKVSWNPFDSKIISTEALNVVSSTMGSNVYSKQSPKVIEKQFPRRGKQDPTLEETNAKNETVFRYNAWIVCKERQKMAKKRIEERIKVEAALVEALQLMDLKEARRPKRYMMGHFDALYEDKDNEQDQDTELYKYILGENEEDKDSKEIKEIQCSENEPDMDLYKYMLGEERDSKECKENIYSENDPDTDLYKYILSENEEIEASKEIKEIMCSENDPNTDLYKYILSENEEIEESKEIKEIMCSDVDTVDKVITKETERCNEGKETKNTKDKDFIPEFPPDSFHFMDSKILHKKHQTKKEIQKLCFQERQTAFKTSLTRLAPLPPVRQLLNKLHQNAWKTKFTTSDIQTLSTEETKLFWFQAHVQHCADNMDTSPRRVKDQSEFVLTGSPYGNGFVDRFKYEAPVRLLDERMVHYMELMKSCVSKQE